MTEIWVKSISFPSYEVSSLGRVRRCCASKTSKIGRILKAAKHYSGYYQHGLQLNNKTKTVRLNRLVCETFYGASPSEDHHAAHIDGDKSNNSSANLYWATRIENEHDKDLHNTRPVGSRHKLAKLTESDVIHIRKLVAIGISKTDVAKSYNVSKSLIGHITNGRNWNHV